MKHLIALGEITALFCAIPQQPNNYRRSWSGGALCAAAAANRLGGHAKLLTQIGNDFLSEEFMEHLRQESLDSDGILRTDSGSMALSFPHPQSNGGIRVRTYRTETLSIPNQEALQCSYFHDVGAFFAGSELLHHASGEALLLRALQLAERKNAITALSVTPGTLLQADRDPTFHKKLYSVASLAQILQLCGTDSSVLPADCTSEVSLLRGKTQLLLLSESSQIRLYSRRSNIAIPLPSLPELQPDWQSLPAAVFMQMLLLRGVIGSALHQQSEEQLFECFRTAAVYSAMHRAGQIPSQQIRLALERFRSTWFS